MNTTKPLRAITALTCMLALAACNPSAQPPVASAPPQLAPTGAPPGVTPSSFHLPEGVGCSGDVARWQAIQNNDLQTGHVDRSVYDQIQGEINTAAAACQAGRDAESRTMISASKRRHGYPG